MSMPDWVIRELGLESPAPKASEPEIDLARVHTISEAMAITGRSYAAARRLWHEAREAAA